MSYGSQYSSYQNANGGNGGNLTDAVVDTMVRWPMRMTGATVDLMLRGMQSMTGGRSGSSATISTSSSQDVTSSSSGSSPNSKSGWTSLFSNQTSGTFDQDLSGDDLKYVIWSIVFTKPGYECILQKQQEELVNYSADSSTYAAVKIAKYLDGARHGHGDRPEAWSERGYPSDSARPKSNRKESSTIIAASGSASTLSSSSSAVEQRAGADDKSDQTDKGWRIPAEDHKFICFLYRVDRRIPRQEEVTRVERFTVERNTRVV